MSSIFDYDNYLDFLNYLVSTRQERHLTRAKMARAMTCQASYFSQVLRGKVHLTEDHVMKLCHFLQFNENATEYFFTLLRLARAGSQELREYLEKQRRILAQNDSEVSARTTAEKRAYSEELLSYYSSSWLPAAVHIATSCHEFQNAQALARRLKIDEEIAIYHLHQLESLGLVKFENGKWNFRGASIHLPKDSPMNLQLQVSRRMLAMNSVTMKSKNSLNYGVIFATNEKVFKELSSDLLDVIQRLNLAVEPSQSEDIFCLCLDLFKV